MKERPILFSGPMVRALLDGSKTQTRRVVKTACVLGREAVFAPRRKSMYAPTFLLPDAKEQAAAHCPYGQPGDRLWVRETWRGVVNIAPPGHYKYAVAHYVPDQEHCRRVEYAATQDKDGDPWRPSIHMPRWASRITLEVTGVRVERLQDISEADAIAEGILKSGQRNASGRQFWRDYRLSGDGSSCVPTAIESYKTLWESINGPCTWEANPWVWVVEFKRTEGGAA